MYATRIPPRAPILGISAALAVMTFGASAQPAGTGWLTHRRARRRRHRGGGDQRAPCHRRAVHSPPTSVNHGFVRTPDGTLTAVRRPGLDRKHICVRHQPIGTTVGRSEVAGGFAGFIRSSSGTFTSFSVPGTTVTLPIAINDSGVVTGVSEDQQNQAFNAFVRTADGTITSFLPPGAIDTEALAINGKGAIAGLYGDSSKAIHGSCVPPTDVSPHSICPAR